ncbi:replicative DNA helicase [Candidatus Dojkabacteria bacterium]|uniref:Replicative DNA helicase n=1 Tax=Candidatus Dojkabacteria bacterium TaxID=2099670 RepID=A0A3M0Z0S4_9BACT|nr:MAG: replicative DNA helicase [Candidatus Dojkabacteria bacterium]
MDQSILQDIDSERAVLGSIFIDEALQEVIFKNIKPEYFQDPKHQVIFETCYNIYSRGINVDPLVVSSELKKSGKLREVGGAKYIVEMIDSVPLISNVDKYISIVKDLGLRNMLRKISNYIMSASMDVTKDINEILDELEKKIFSSLVLEVNQDLYDAATLVEMQMKLTDELAKNPENLRGISTGINSLDRILGGLHKSDLIIVAARPGVGKSAFTFDIARHIAVNLSKSVLLFSLEMPALQVISRILAQQTEINLWNIRMGKLLDSDYHKFVEGMTKISKSKIFVDDTPGISLQALKTKSRKLKLEKGLDLIVIDYLQLMQTSGKSDNRAFEIGEISRSLKILARELNIPIIALSQLNRSVENRQEKIPHLSDLRESGSIEQDADLVLFLGRDVLVDPEDDYVSVVDVYVAKHRNGPTGKFKLKFDGSKQKFYDVL